MLMDDTQSVVGRYLEYVRLAKESFEKLLELYPEFGTLSAKEMEVLEMLMTDKSMVQIARELYVSVSTVHFHSKNIYRKLNIKNRRQILIRYKDLL